LQLPVEVEGGREREVSYDESGGESLGDVELAEVDALTVFD